MAGIGIKFGITLGLEIDSDDTGYYWQPNARFNGVRVYITKYVKVEEDVGGDDGSLLKIGNAPNLIAKKTKEYVWIEEKKYKYQQTLLH